MRTEKADADEQIPGMQALAILNLIILILFCTPLVVGLWIAVLGPPIH